MPVPQFLAGLRTTDAVRGVFLSREGVNVYLASGDDLLISPFDANLMILARGIAYVPYGAVATVYYSEPASAPPLILFAGYGGGLYTVPQICYHNSSGALGDRFVVTSYSDRITIYNRLSALAISLGGASANDLYVRYFIVAKDAT